MRSAHQQLLSSGELERRGNQDGATHHQLKAMVAGTRLIPELGEGGDVSLSSFYICTFYICHETKQVVANLTNTNAK